MDEWTAGDYTGLGGGVVVILGAMGKGLAWLLNWNGERSDAKAARLRAWEESLVRREKEARAAMELRFRGLEVAVIKLRRLTGALRACLQEVTTDLRIHAPDSAAADRAESMLRNAWADMLDFEVPEDLAELTRLLDEDEGDGR